MPEHGYSSVNSLVSLAARKAVAGKSKSEALSLINDHKIAIIQSELKKAAEREYTLQQWDKYSKNEDEPLKLYENNSELLKSGMNLLGLQPREYMHGIDDGVLCGPDSKRWIIDVQDTFIFFRSITHGHSFTINTGYNVGSIEWMGSNIIVSELNLHDSIIHVYDFKSYIRSAIPLQEIGSLTCVGLWVMNVIQNTKYMVTITTEPEMDGIEGERTFIKVWQWDDTDNRFVLYNTLDVNDITFCNIVYADENVVRFYLKHLCEWKYHTQHSYDVLVYDAGTVTKMAIHNDFAYVGSLGGTLTLYSRYTWKRIRENQIQFGTNIRDIYVDSRGNVMVQTGFQPVGAIIYKLTMDMDSQ